MVIYLGSGWLAEAGGGKTVGLTERALNLCSRETRLLELASRLEAEAPAPDPMLNIKVLGSQRQIFSAFKLNLKLGKKEAHLSNL